METKHPTPAIELDNPISSIAKIVHKLAADLSHADRQEVISASLVRISTGTEHALSAVRWSLADWLKDQTSIPQPTQDTTISEAQYLDTGKRRGRHGELLLRKKREAKAIDEDTWKRMLGRLTTKEQQVAELIVADWPVVDICTALGINHGTVRGIRLRIEKRLADFALWNPILDALYGIADSKIGRAEFDTDLSEYRMTTAARPLYAPIASEETAAQRQPLFTTWFVPCHEKRQAPLTWYPGQPIKRWEPCEPYPYGIVWDAWKDLGISVPKQIGKVGHTHYAPKTTPTTAETERTGGELKNRERAGLNRGERFLFHYTKKPVVTKKRVREFIRETPTHLEFRTYNATVTTEESGWMVSAPVIRREYSADGMFRRHVQ